MDTNVLVHAIRPHNPNGEQARRAKFFLSNCDKAEKDGVRLLVPAVVAAEFLCGCDSSFERSAEELQAKFPIIPFDLGAALRYREVWIAKCRLKAPLEENSSREKMARDAMIVAMALDRNVDEIVTFDNDLVRLAQACGVSAAEPPHSNLLPGLEMDNYQSGD